MENIGLKKSLLIIVLLCSPVLQAEDAYPIAWLDQFSKEETNYQIGESVATDSIGNTYVVGSTNSSLHGEGHSGSLDAFVVKYDTDGIRQWTRLFGTSSQDQGKSITVDNNDDIYVAGYTFGEFPGQTSSGNVDSFIVKYNGNGTRAWLRQFGSEYVDYAYSVTADSNGNLYVAGSVGGGFAGNDHDVLITKFSNDGTRGWARELDASGDAYGFSIAADSSGTIYITGSVEGNFPGFTYKGQWDIFLAALNATDGADQWIQQLGTTTVDLAYSVTIGKNGIVTTGDGENVYIAGNTYGWLNGEPNSGDRDGFIVAFRKNGAVLWTKLIGSSNGRMDKISSIATDASGNLYAIGITTGNFYQYPPLNSMFNRGYTDIFVTKVNSDKDVIWLKMVRIWQ